MTYTDAVTARAAIKSHLPYGVFDATGKLIAAFVAKGDADEFVRMCADQGNHELKVAHLNQWAIRRVA